MGKTARRILLEEVAVGDTSVSDAKAILLDGVARIILVANQDILPGMELLYDYGDRDPASILAHPWLAT